MKTKKQAYVELLRRMDSDFIAKSAKNPTEYMTRIHIALHMIVLRERSQEMAECLNA